MTAFWARLENVNLTMDDILLHGKRFSLGLTAGYDTRKLVGRRHFLVWDEWDAVIRRRLRRVETIDHVHVVCAFHSCLLQRMEWPSKT